MAQESYVPLEGKRIALKALTGPFRPCRACGHQVGYVIIENIGPHAGHVRCDECARHCAWLSCNHLAAMLAEHGADQREAG